MYDLIIIGGGPAALAAATFALGKQLRLRIIFQQLGGWTGAHQRIVPQIEEERIAGEGLVRQLMQEVERANITLHDKVRCVLRQDDTFVVETQSHGTLKQPRS